MAEKRNSQRIEVNEPGTMSWQDDSGDMRLEKIVLINLADFGAMIESSSKLPLRTSIQLKVPSWEVDGAASVRYCRQRGLKYRIGLELFTSISSKPKQRRWT